MLKKIVFLGLLISCILGITMAGPAQAIVIPNVTNGDFETGDLTGWNGYGNVGVQGAFLGYTPIDGSYVGFLNTFGIGGVCSWLYSDNVFPTYVPKAIQVMFKVRYSTDDPITPTQYDDPFHAMLKFDDGNGDVTMVTISTNAVSAGPGFSVQDLVTGTILPARSNPTFVAGFIPLVSNTSHLLLVSGTIPYTGCAPINIRFDLCGSLDTGPDGFVEVDDVDITFVNAPGASTTWWKYAPNAPVLCP